MSKQRNVWRGMAAGIAGGLVASWVMNEFMSGPGEKLQQSVESTNGHRPQGRQQSQGENQDQDATMKTADPLLVSTVTGGRHLSLEQQKKMAPAVHYGFGGIMGGLYGALAEVWPEARSGFGTTFGSVLFAGADLVAVPVLHLGPSAEEQGTAAQTNPLAGHVVYGVTTELVRRVVRAMF